MMSYVIQIFPNMYFFDISYDKLLIMVAHHQNRQINVLPFSHARANATSNLLSEVASFYHIWHSLSVKHHGKSDSGFPT